MMKAIDLRVLIGIATAGPEVRGLWRRWRASALANAGCLEDAPSAPQTRRPRYRLSPCGYRLLAAAGYQLNWS